MSSLLRDLRERLHLFMHPLDGARAWAARVSLMLALLFCLASAVVLGCGWLLLTAARYSWPAWQTELYAFTIASAVWGLLLTLLLLASRVAPPNLFGPVLFYDLIRSARRTRFVVVRTLYALLLAVILGWLFIILIVERGSNVRSSEMTTFANNFFYTFAVIQYVTVVILTPSYTAGAIAEEKERKTLEFLLATDLHNRELILGKLVSRMFNLTFILLAGLPILSFLQFLGGIDPQLVFASFAVTALTMYSLAGLSLLNSVVMRRARDAIVLTFLGFVTYIFLATLSRLVYIPIYGLSIFPQNSLPWFPFTLGDLSDWLNAGNAGYASYSLLIRGGGVLEEDLPAILGAFALFHGILGTLCVGTAVWRLRTIALSEQEKGTKAPPKSVVPARLVTKPKVKGAPMLWKEIHAEGGVRLNALGRIIVGVLVLASFAPTIIAIYLYFDGKIRWSSPNGDSVGKVINVAQLRMMGTVVAVLLLLSVVVRAANSISGEREKDTLDSLLTSRLDTREILFGKWVGAIFSVRWGWVWLGLIYGIGVLTGGMHPVCLPVILVAWFVYASVFAGIGLWFSAVWKRTLRATLASLAMAIFVGGGHWIVMGLCCYFPLALSRVSDRSIEWPLAFHWGQTPPLVLGLFAIHGDEFRHSYERDSMYRWIIGSLFGLAIWSVASFVLWAAVLHRFRLATCRDLAFQPEYVPARPRIRPIAERRPGAPSARAKGIGSQEISETPLDALPAEGPATEEKKDT